MPLGPAALRRLRVRLIRDKLRPTIVDDEPETRIMFACLVQLIDDALAGARLKAADFQIKGRRRDELASRHGAARLIFGQGPLDMAERLGLDGDYVRRVIDRILAHTGPHTVIPTPTPSEVLPDDDEAPD